MNSDEFFMRHFEKTIPVEAELSRKREQEHLDADALMRDAAIYRSMPEDLRSRAREWRLEAFMCAVWSNAWQAGYLQAARDREAVPEREAEK